MAAYGPLTLIGSGETHRQGRQVQEEVLQTLPVPARVAILKTPAGFQPSADAVAGKLREFVERSLQNYRPQVMVIDACRKGGHGDPDDPAIVAPLAEATYILAGPGSPTYTVRHLADTQTLVMIRERWAAGAGLTFASAAAIAMGRHVLPIYEIYKAGEDLGWRDGLDLLGPFGLEVAIVPHWNNQEGGAGLDTTHCFMGTERFAQLRALLPPSATILGIDEHTSCIIDLVAGSLRVRGQGQVTILRGDDEVILVSGADVPLSRLGAPAAVATPR